VEIRIYFEGDVALKHGFRQLFADLEKKAFQARSAIEFFAAKNGVSDYRKAVKTFPSAWNILLKDSEQLMPNSPAALCKKLGIDAKRVNDVFWMVVMMESWFLTDPDALANYYGKGFSSKAIGRTKDVEQIKKSDVLQRLSRATQKTGKRKYDKIRDAPYILERLDANRVQVHAPNCRRLFNAVTAKLVAVRLNS
jgi:hypothetical protein